MLNQLTTRRLAARRAPRVAAPVLGLSLPAAHCPLPTNTPPRRGISLLEVLISMFVLLFGLMGVAAVFPVGNHYAAKSEQFDRGAGLAEAAMADLKARGMLMPERWFYPTQPNGAAPLPPPAVYSLLVNETFRVPINRFDRDEPQPGDAFVIDPMGAGMGLYDATTPITANLDSFPYVSFINADNEDGALNLAMPEEWRVTGTQPGLYGQHWPIRRVTLQQSMNTLLNPRVAESIFRLHDDITSELPKEDDRPGIMRWTAVDRDPTTGNDNNTPKYAADDTLLARQYAGNYSWLATVVPTSADTLASLQPANSRFGSDLYEVSVAVFNKREPLPPSAATERLLEAQMLQGNELVLYGTAGDADQAIENLENGVEDIRAGNWIAVAGIHPTTGAFLMRWYQILSIDNETEEGVTLPGVTGARSVRRVMLHGPDWPLTDLGSGVLAANNLRAILLPGVISVATQVLPMETAQ